MPASQSTNGGNGNGNNDRWDDGLDAQRAIVKRSDDLDLETNFGHGNYDRDLFYKQGENFRTAAKAMDLFQDILLERAIYETKVKLATQGIAFYDDNNQEAKNYSAIDFEDDDHDQAHRRREIRARGNEIWQKLEDSNRVLSDKQVAAIIRMTGHDLEWQSIYEKMLVFYHEASRSKNSELLRNFLTGVRELRSDGDGETARALLGGSSS